jgi:hypothetical protein
VTFLKAALVQSAFIAAVSGGAVAPAQTASSDVVCNRAGECWHSRDRLDYPAGVGITFHTTAWGLAHRADRWRWQRDRFDRGYYRNGVWIAF